MASEDDKVPLKTMDSLDVDEAKLDFVFGNYAKKEDEGIDAELDSKMVVRLLFSHRCTFCKLNSRTG